jgi:hypothetical protein
MWTAQRSKIQRLMSQQLQLQRQQREQASLPNLPPAHTAAVHNPLSPDDFAIRQQGLINCLCPESSHWLQANPAFRINRLTDNAFMIVFWERSKFRVMWYDTNIYIHANYNNNNINDSIYMHYVIAL